MRSITLSGKAIDNNDKYWITIQEEKNEWYGGEPLSTRKILISKRGKWDFHLMPTSGTTLINKQEKIVILLLDFDPSQVQVGDTGSGKTEDTARQVTWQVDSV